MFSCSREMYAHQQLRYFCLALLILPVILVTEATSNARHSRRRPTLSTGAKQSIEDVTSKSETVADQIALAATRTETNQYRRGGAYASDGGEDFPYGNLEMNLIRPEGEPIHTQITAKYSITTKNNQADLGSLEDSETAEEYVAKAMQRYGTRLREPIHIPSEPEMPSKTAGQGSGNSGSYEYFEMSNKQQQHELQQQHQQHQQQQQQEQADAKAYLAAEMQAQLQAQMQQAEMQQALQAEKQQQLETQTEQGQAAVNGASVSQQPAPVYETKDPVTRSYEVYDDNSAYEGAEAVDRQYRTKYVYQPVSYRGAISEQDAEEKVRVSASTEIPKAEIMKQIEKSVMKYMKELEAEGKIVTSPQQQQQQQQQQQEKQEQQPKTYYKVINVPVSEEKRIVSTTTRPKYTSSTPSYGESYLSSSAPGSAGSSSRYSPGSRHHKQKHGLKSHYSSAESENSASVYQHQDISDALAPNVEFVYKIKTRAPLQTATLKTVSKPYTLPLKAGSYEQFDHSAALKNLEEFDLSHVVTTQEPEDHAVSAASVSVGKPNKLYFNSEIYHDINSLPYKPEKARTLAAEYRKVKGSDLSSAEFKAYSGYFAEPAPADVEKELTSAASTSSADDGYPLMNPYQYILKKEPLPNKYDDSPTAAGSWEQSRKPHFAASISAQKSLEYDSYSPKFNNNPEGYGYQHTYKGERERDQQKYTQRHPSGKRGKRGGAPHPSVVKKGVRSAAAVKDIEANLALRPPPKV